MALILSACGDEGDSGISPNPPPEPPSTPTALWALPGPADGQVTLTWLPASSAVAFNVYRGTSPGVTPSNGTKIGPVSNSYTDGRLSPGTYYYIVTQFSGSQESAPSEEVKVVYDRGIALAVRRPVPGGPGGDDLLVEILITSAYEVASASARVGSRQAPLVVAPTSGTPPAWRGTIDLRGLSHGQQRVTLAVSDVQGHAVEASVPFVYDTPPVLTVTAPLNYGLARPSVRVTATCADDDPAGCSSISVALADETFTAIQQLTSVSGGRVDADLTPSVPGIGGAWLRVLASDSRGQADTVYRNLVIDLATTAAQPIAVVPGRILDVSDDGILYVDSSAAGSVLKVRNRASSTDLTIASAPAFGSAYLAPGVVLFVELTDVSPYTTLYEWRGGSVTSLGGVVGAVAVNGGYAIYLQAGGLTRRTLATGASITIVASGTEGTEPSVGPDGDVAFWTYPEYAVWWYQDGTGAIQISPFGTGNTFPLTDGTQVVYRRHSEVAPGQVVWDIVRYDAGGESILGNERTAEPRPADDYAAVNGWVGFTRPGSGDQLQVWTRSPLGVERQVTNFGVSSVLKALGPNGEVAFHTLLSETVPGQVQFTEPPYGTLAPIGRITRVVFLSDGPVKFLGNTLFSITP